MNNQNALGELLTKVLKKLEAIESYLGIEFVDDVETITKVVTPAKYKKAKKSKK